MKDFTLYSMPSSGNSYKVRLMMALTGRTYKHVPLETNSVELETAKASGTLPLGKLPVLILPDGNTLTESGAILWYLAQNTDFLPQNALAQARALEWMFFEQNRLEPVIAVRASLRSYAHLADQATPEKMDALLRDGTALLSLIERDLKVSKWLSGDAPTITDIALYGYVHSSGTRGGYDMDSFPNINAWCARIAALPGYVPLDYLP
jgi:glutathione S-transferase